MTDDDMQGTDTDNTAKAVYDGDDRRGQADDYAYFNAQFDSKTHIVMPGEFSCTDDAGDMLVATIGSGVAIAVYETELKMGALGYILVDQAIIDAFPHFDDGNAGLIEQACEPLDSCIAALKQKGAGKNRIRVRLFGGTSLPGDPDDMGTKNYIFVKEYLARKGISVMSEDLSGPYLRHLHFSPTTGRTIRRMLRRKVDYDRVQEIESGYISKESD